MTFEITFSGQVQGVGFRPFVFNLAQQYGLNGFISNNERGVIIQVNGSASVVNNFYNDILQNPPALALIDQCSIFEISAAHFEHFEIRKSSKGEKLNLPLTPDFSICLTCKDEIVNTEDRRYYYPFTTCVNCGPRWAITKNFPFDREKTTIASHAMCKDCADEYMTPSNRRFHSQTNTCPNCGFRLSFCTGQGEEVLNSEKQIFDELAKQILNGAIIAIKNTSGFLLCCDAKNHGAVQKLRTRKQRPKKPFAVLYPDLTWVKDHFEISEEEESQLKDAISPIVILSHPKPENNLVIPDIAPGLKQIGVMLPYSGILSILMDALQFPLVATSGNIHGSPILAKNNDAIRELAGVADFFLMHDLEIFNPQDDSVIKFSTKNKQKIIFRRSRGMAPTYFGSVKKSKKAILALGAHLKSTIAFLPNDHLYVSQYLGNLDHFDVYERFTKTTSYFMELFEQEPAYIMTDGHPAYQSSLFGKELTEERECDLIKVQHHKAHFTSVLGEHDLFEHNRVLGVIWDGTGYGDDGQIWGGEFFLYQHKEIHRLAHFEYFDWLAGDRMSLEPRLSLLSLADESMEELLMTKFTNEEWQLYKALSQKNQLSTSSVGRLFDAVASLLGICDLNSYEGEAAILLENQLTSSNNERDGFYLFASDEENLSPKLIIKGIFLDLKKGISRDIIVSKFMVTLAKIVYYMAEKYKVKDLAFSGGVFQNSFLVDLLIDLKGNDYNLYFNKSFSPNDENISFGQMMYALHMENLGS